MEKEMKKLLLVAVSVGVFLLVTVTVAIIILTPKAQTQETSFSSSVPYTGTRAPVQEIMPPQPAVISMPEPVFSLDNDVPAIADTDNGDSLTIQIPMPSTAAVPDTALQSQQTGATPQTTARAQEPAVAAPAAAPSQSTARPAAQTQPAASRTTQTARTPATPARPATTARTINDYWVQTGAFSAQVRAEDARELLAAKGITSIIENREINGRLWYRVRLGPYTSEREANHWLEIVKLIDGFSDSQIRQTVRQN
ncbi:MAG: SPOR domain-containing protein [Treponema sp.]|nr:SPOR domain-containing protein [Treponema sp.]